MVNLGIRQGRCGLGQQSRRELILEMGRTETARCWEKMVGTSKVDLETPGSRGRDDHELWSLWLGMQHTQGWMAVLEPRGGLFLPCAPRHTPWLAAMAGILVAVCRHGHGNMCAE